MSVFAKVRLMVDVELQQPWDDSESMGIIIKRAEGEALELVSQVLANTRVIKVVPQGVIEVRTTLVNKDKS